MDNRREVIFGRLLSIANVLSDKVFEKGKPSAHGYLDKLQKKPFETFVKIHQDLMQYAHKFGPDELTLIDMMGELMNELSIEDAENDTPLKDNFLIPYYSQNHSLRTLDQIMGTQEAADLWGYKSSDHVKRLCRVGKVKCVQIGNTWVLDRNQPNPRQKGIE